jgi:hypothetical protein
VVKSDDSDRSQVDLVAKPSLMNDIHSPEEHQRQIMLFVIKELRIKQKIQRMESSRED